ncbi:Pyranose oxidase [metagenome]|uniref:Pyranose oxidase n=1 Tax=metagenome TaxID=256318 RepID=A0A2P2C407_9ZZZZ
MEFDPIDVLVVGSGLMGSSVARLVREVVPEARILMVDGGSVIGDTPGRHLHDAPQPTVSDGYEERVASGIQGHYVGAPMAQDEIEDVADVPPGMYSLAAYGHDGGALPGFALPWNVGGMGVHWTAATPTPWGSEIPSFLDEAEFQGDLATASRLLRVQHDPLGPTAAREAVMAALEEVLGASCAPGRELQPMPMAVSPGGRGRLERTGPSTIFPPIAGETDPAFELRAGVQAVRLNHKAGSVTGADLRDIATGVETSVRSRVTVVCADAFRTPQLLFASGIRPSALGRYLNEHAFLSGRVVVDPGRVGIELTRLRRALPGEWAVSVGWLPHSDQAQPFHGYLADSVYVDDDGSPLAYGAGITLYVPTEIREQNRIEFSETETDAAGLPRMIVHFDYSDADLALINQARVTQQRAAERLGPFDPATESTLLAPGTSLHVTGTVRMGATDDGTSVSDPDGRVWDFDNLYVAGCGVIPTPLASNSTIAGVTLAVRTARAVAAQLGLAVERGLDTRVDPFVRTIEKEK